MTAGSYRLLSQVGAGADGVSFRASGEAGWVEVRSLQGARDDPPRWAELSRRLRLAALLEHPAALRVVGMGLEETPPFAALEWTDGDLASRLSEGGPLSGPEALAMGRDLAGALAEAHRLGLVHGRLSASQVRSAGGGAWKLDFSGIAARPSPLAESDAPGPSVANFAGDVQGLGTLLRWATDGRPEVSDGLGLLVVEMLAEDPEARPGAAEVRDRLAGMALPSEVFDFPDSFAETAPPGAEGDASDFERDAFPPAPEDGSGREGRGRLRLLGELGRSSPPEVAIPGQLGRFRLLERIGRGGMGSVFRAEDLGDGSIVAVKVLNPSWATQPGALDRFRKEARMLAEVNNPYVTNLLEFNEDGGISYLVLEFVTGEPLGRRLRALGRLPEPAAAEIMADVARALVDAHERGIVHRDVKPDNILLVEPADGGPVAEASTARTRALPGVKLSDFGLARRVREADSMRITQPGKVLGTPFYMSPEQCSGEPVGPGSDVYAMGATLFHMLAGRPPFLSDDALGLLAMHRWEAPPSLRAIDPMLSMGICLVVEKALAKSPEGRYADAGALLDDLERLSRGEPIGIAAHPSLPECDPSEVLRYDFRWELAATPRQLWPFVSDTERLNRAVGLPAVKFKAVDRDDRGVRRFGTMTKLGLTASWEEHPFEWVESRRMGVLREYSRGPFRWLASVVDLAPGPGGGTLLTHQVRLRPRGLLGRLIAAVEVNLRGGRALDRVYRRIEAAVAVGAPDRSLDAFEEPSPLAGRRRSRLDRLIGALEGRGVRPAAAERLGDFLATAAPQELARIRPLELAARWGLDPQEVVAACLHGAREGLLVLGWDLICPACRISSEVVDSLRSLRAYGHCEACRIDYALDFAGSVEMIFRSHPEVREPELGVYCIGGPAHSPHVIAQARVAPGERMALELALPAGAYRVRSPHLPESLEFRVAEGATGGRWEVEFAREAASATPRVLKPGGQSLTFANPHDCEVVLRVERDPSLETALTAAKASSMALFRDLFPGEILSPGQLVAVTNVTILLTDLDGVRDLYEALGDARAFGVIHEHLRRLDDAIRREGGALIKTVGDGVLATFDDPTSAVRAGLDLPPAMPGGPPARNLSVRAAVHRGPAMAATLNEHLDYFGLTIRQASTLLDAARGGELVLGQEVAAEPRVSMLLAARGLEAGLSEIDLPGRPGSLAHRLPIAGR